MHLYCVVETSALGVLFIAVVNLKCRLSIIIHQSNDKSNTSLTFKHMWCHATWLHFLFIVLKTLYVAFVYHVLLLRLKQLILCLFIKVFCCINLLLKLRKGVMDDIVKDTIKAPRQVYWVEDTNRLAITTLEPQFAIIICSKQMLHYIWKLWNFDFVQGTLFKNCVSIISWMIAIWAHSLSKQFHCVFIN